MYRAPLTTRAALACLGLQGPCTRMGGKGTDETCMRALPCSTGQEREKATFLPLGGLWTNPARCLHAGQVFLAVWDLGLASLAHRKWELG